MHYFSVHNIFWTALPKRFGKWNRVWRRFGGLRNTGVFETFFDHLASLSSSAHLVQMFDSTIVRADGQGFREAKRTRHGGRWGIGQLYRILTRRAYIGEHEFNKRSKSKELKPASEVVTVAVPPLVDRETFDKVQALLRQRNPKVTPARVTSGPTLLTGICHCAKCGGAMTIRTGKSGQYRYYTCSIKARQGETGCSGRSIPMDKLDRIVARHIEERLLQPDRPEEILAEVLDRRQEQGARRREQLAELRMRIEDTKIRLKRLYEGVEAGIFDPKEPALAERMDGLRGIHDQAFADARRIEAMLENAGDKAITPEAIRKLAASAREKMRLAGGGYRRDHLRALAQRVEVGEREVHISGSKTELLRVLTSTDAAKTSMISVPTSVPNWRTGWDSNPRSTLVTGLKVRRLQPLGHRSARQMMGGPGFEPGTV